MSVLSDQGAAIGVVGAGHDDYGMGTRRRRQRLGERARALPLGELRGRGCLCCGLVRLAYSATCPVCASVWQDEVVIPSNGVVGDAREVLCSCACGGDAVGVGRIVELLH